MNLQKAYKILEENKKTYNEIAEEFYQTRRKYSPELEELKRYIKPEEKVLDLGCGTGRLYEIFKNKNIDYTGVDFSKNLINIARGKYGNHFQVADILSLPCIQKTNKIARGSNNGVGCKGLPFSNNYFDSVWAIAVLHHIPSNELRKRVLSEIKRVLNPNGRVIATFWKIKYFLRKDVFIPFHGKKRYYHVFTKREIGKLFEKSGFKIEESRFLKRNNKKAEVAIMTCWPI